MKAYCSLYDFLPSRSLMTELNLSDRVLDQLWGTTDLVFWFYGIHQVFMIPSNVIRHFLMSAEFEQRFTCWGESWVDQTLFLFRLWSPGRAWGHSGGCSAVGQCDCFKFIAICSCLENHKGLFTAHAIEEPFCVPQRTFQSTVLKITMWRTCGKRIQNKPWPWNIWAVMSSRKQWERQNVLFLFVLRL